MDLVSLLTSTTSKGNPNAWDISKTISDPSTQGFDVSKIQTESLGLAAPSDSAINGMFVHPQGIYSYDVNQSTQLVYQRTLNSRWVTWQSTATSFNVSSQEATPTGLWFKTDGTKMYIVGSGGDEVNEYNLSTAWDVTSASYVQNFSVATEDNSPFGVIFNPDGTQMFIIGDQNNSIFEYALSSAWDISTASYVQSAATITTPRSGCFNQDGTKLFIGNGGTVQEVVEYALSTPYDISTLSETARKSISHTGTTPRIRGVFYDSYGGFFYYTWRDGGVSPTLNRIYMRLAGGYFDVETQEANPNGLFISPDGTKMYVCGETGDDVNEYSLSTAWDVTTASYTQNFSVGLQESAPESLYFKPDGTKMYILGRTGDDVNEYALSSAWDISTASYTQNFSISAQETEPTGLAFSSDGINMYVIGTAGDDVNQYVLGTAWDISTASYLQNYSVSAQEIAPTSVEFSPDGLNMYTVGTAGTIDQMDQYVLTTPWDISTASFVQAIIINITADSVEEIRFKPDGTKYFLLGKNVPDQVVQYAIDPDL